MTPRQKMGILKAETGKSPSPGTRKAERQMFNYYVGRLNFRKSNVKFMGAFPSMESAKAFVSLRDCDLFLNSVAFITHNGQTIYYSEPERANTPPEWLPFSKAIVVEYTSGLDTKTPLEEILWADDAESIIRRGLEKELTPVEPDLDRNAR